MKSVFVCVVLLLSCRFAAAQSPGLPEAPANIDFDRIVLGKSVVRDGVPRLALIKPAFVSEPQQRLVEVTRLVAEQRARRRVVDGKTVEEVYTVNVPVVEQKEVVMIVSKATEPLRFSLPIADLKAWDIQGNELSREEIAERFKSPTHAFALHGPDFSLAPFYASVLRPKTLFVYSAELAEKLAPPAPHAPLAPLEPGAPLAPPGPLAPAAPAAEQP